LTATIVIPGHERLGLQQMNVKKPGAQNRARCFKREAKPHIEARDPPGKQLTSL
jgi:hypothetical protein